ncbi:isopentenyl phosphate kinase family protein [Candidatus Bathyarchaeota archaeon]|nr:isopentenyl phosphate kinase family protein [Candidatus Bathyarchaeota archaeon]MBS7628145.1 isopentenyl phosphate kinase family protein [Candidatus Bathyarchaeota archaeon]
MRPENPRIGEKATVIKLGGSVVTKKAQFAGPKPNFLAIRRLADEIIRAKVFPLVVVHGAGSFGHQLAFKHRLMEGFQEPSQLIGLAETHRSVMELNNLVVRELILKGMAAFSMPPSSLALTRKGRIAHFSLEPIKMALNLGITPVLFGDVVYDEISGFSILSGDQLMVKLALELKASRIIVGVDVDGLYTADPRLNPQAQLIRKATAEELRSFLLKTSISTPNRSFPMDVTGGMLGKLQEVLKALEEGIEVKLVNALKPNRVYRALMGEEGLGTNLLPGG